MSSMTTPDTLPPRLVLRMHAMLRNPRTLERVLGLVLWGALLAVLLNISR